MVQLPIPNDWDGETWECVQIQWPSSDKWFALLAGLVTSPLRGRFWDERTGTITDVQAVGREIDFRNLPFRDCSGESITLVKEFLYQVIQAQESEDDTMACCANPKAFRKNNGWFEVLDCCGDWVQVFQLTTQTDEGVYVPPPDVDPSQDIYPCGMATALADTIEALAGFIWDNADNTFPAFMPSKAQSFIGLDLNNLQVINAANQALIMKGSVLISYGIVDLERSDVIESDWSEEVACMFLPFMGADGTADPDELYNAFTSWFRQKYPISASGNNIFIQNYYTHIAAAIGKGNMRDIAESGQFVEATCICEGQIEGDSGSSASGWYLGAPHAVTMPAPLPPTYPDYGFTWFKEAIPHDIYGVVVVMATQTGTMDHWKRTNAPAPAEMGVHDVYMSGTNSDFFPLAVPAAYAFISVAQMTELNAIGELVGYARVDPLPGNGSEVVLSPVATIQQIALMACTVYDTVPGTVQMTLRWLHNINSPSHA